MLRLRHVMVASGLAAFAWLPAPLAAIADREVVWTTATGAALERELNRHAARGLRVAAVSEGLPCTVTALQAPESPGPPVRYRVVADRDLDANLGALVDGGFVPRLGHRSPLARPAVIFERLGEARASSSWRTIEFARIEDLEPALTAAAREGYRPQVLVRYPVRSWPGLSNRGLILASRSGDAARDVTVIIGTSRNIDPTTRAVADASAQGFGLDLLFTGSPDGSHTARRERLVVALSRAAGVAKPADAVHLASAQGFGTYGRGIPLGVAPFWDDSYVYAWTAAPRRQMWGSPIRLTENEASCGSLDLKLRIDAPRDHTWNIVGLAARKLSTGGYELVYVTDQRLGFE